MRTDANPRLVMVTNIPTPYRIHQWNVMDAHFREQGVAFEALFLAQTERRRHWKLSLEACRFQYLVAPGWTVSFRDQPFSLNPGVVVDLFRRPPTWVVLGGAWQIPTVVLVSILARVRGVSWCLGWLEATLEDTHFLPTDGFAARVKSLFLGPYEGWVVPGRRFDAYARALAGDDVALVRYPNTVSEPIYRDAVARARQRRAELRAALGVGPETLLAFWPARLAPEKGILPFLEAIETLPRDRYVILVAGEGPARGVIEEHLARTGNRSVRLLGHQGSDALVDLYAAADLMLLPSLSEPFGFVVVEALCAGLPVFLSDRVGAVPEALVPGENGWLVDPTDPSGVRRAFEEALGTPRARLEEMGRISSRIAAESFDSAKGAARFLRELQATFPPKRRGRSGPS